jgi:hypothetical protein
MTILPTSSRLNSDIAGAGEGVSLPYKQEVRGSSPRPPTIPANSFNGFTPGNSPSTSLETTHNGRSLVNSAVLQPSSAGAPADERTTHLNPQTASIQQQKDQ